MEKYMVVNHTGRITKLDKDYEAFAKKVNVMIELGFKPIGGISITVSVQLVYMAQALVHSKS